MSDVKVLELLTPLVRPAPEFNDLESVNRYCTRFSTQFYSMAIDLEIAEAIVRRMIQQLPTGPRGKISRARAQVVARHLGRAADDCYDAAAKLDRVMPALRQAIARRLERGHAVPRRWQP